MNFLKCQSGCCVAVIGGTEEDNLICVPKMNESPTGLEGFFSVSRHVFFFFFMMFNN